MDISKKRKQLKDVFKEINDLEQSFMERDPILNGGVCQTKTKCGNLNCKCMREGKLHTVWRYYYTEDGKNKVKTLKKADVLNYSRLTERYIKFRSARARLVKLHKELLKLLNSIEEKLIEEGRKKI